jgi:integrase
MAAFNTGRKLKKSSINRDIGMLKNLARWGYKKRYLSSNYYDLVDAYPETDSQKKRPFTDEEIQKIIDNTKYPQLEAHIFSIWHGMRAGEICPLECSDFVWSNNPKIEKDYIKIRNKPHLNTLVKTKQSERDVPIHPFWRNHLKKVWEQARKKSNFFLLTYEGKPLSPGGLSSYTRKLFKKLKFAPKELSFHSARQAYVCNKDKRRRWKH